MCTTLPNTPRVVDLGCGAGAQTLYLAELTSGPITAIDTHEPSIRKLIAEIDRRGLSGRVRAVVGDMTRPAEVGLAAGSADVVWSEGALYNVGIAPALQICGELLREDGYLVFTESVWRRANPPHVVREMFDVEYPTMGTVQDVLAAIKTAGFRLQGHFTLPDEAWWDDFYTPMERRIAEMRVTYAGDHEAQGILERLAEEPQMHRQYADYYAYEYFVTQR